MLGSRRVIGQNCGLCVCLMILLVATLVCVVFELAHLSVWFVLPGRGTWRVVQGTVRRHRRRMVEGPAKRLHAEYVQFRAAALRLLSQ